MVKNLSIGNDKEKKIVTMHSLEIIKKQLKILSCVFFGTIFWSSNFGWIDLVVTYCILLVWQLFIQKEI